MLNKISVLMSVYNDKIEYFKAAVQSIKKQTYSNWELIIINDGDCENDKEYRKYLEKIKDDRIIYILNEYNQGISVCLNQALKISRGEFIAKMDSDDIALPERFEKQVRYFNTHPKCNVLGTKALEFGDSHELLLDYNNYNQKMRSILLLFRNIGLVHPSAMIRRKFLDEYKIRYDEHFRKALDYRLWVECTKYSKIDCLDEVLLLYRRHSTQISTAGKESQDFYRDEIRLLQLKKLYSGYNEIERKLHLHFCDRKVEVEDLLPLKEWCEKLIRLNEEKGLYDKFIFKGMLYSETLILVCKLKNKVSHKLFMELCKHYICLESMYICFYNKTINISNNIKKRLFPIIHKKFIRRVNEYIKEMMSY